MADIDVAAVSLAVPSNPAYLVTVRPALSVKNNGRSSVVASGYVRAYKAGQLIYSSPVESLSIPAGETRNATATNDWTPDSVGFYTFNGYVSCPNDQVEANNNLASVTIQVIEGTPPPPPVVTSHASQHEAGGTDELNVAGLPGELSEDQPPKDHASKHEQGGGDELSIAGLHGTTADPQLAAAHGNERHLESFASAADIAEAVNNHNEDPTPHDVAAFEKQANKGQINGYCPLDDAAHVDPARLYFATDSSPKVRPMSVAEVGDGLEVCRVDHVHQGPGGVAAVRSINLPAILNPILRKVVPPLYMFASHFYVFRLDMMMTATGNPGDKLDVVLYVTPSGGAGVVLGSMSHTFATPLAAGTKLILKLWALHHGANTGRYFWTLRTATAALAGGTIVAGSGAGAAFDETLECTIDVSCAWSGATALAVEIANLALVSDDVTAGL